MAAGTYAVCRTAPTAVVRRSATLFAARNTWLVASSRPALRLAASNPHARGGEPHRARQTVLVPKNFYLWYNKHNKVV